MDDDDSIDRTWFEHNVKESDYLSFKGLPDGWYSHKHYPVWNGSNPYMVMDGSLYEISEDDYLTEISDDGDIFGYEGVFTDSLWYRISMKFWYGKYGDNV